MGVTTSRAPSSPERPTRVAPYPRATAWTIAVLAALTVVVRLPFLTMSASPDEGGLLLLAGQWSPGRSLYGDYWVDRPPLLIGFFAVADRLGGLVALRVLGLVLVAAAVVLAGLVGRSAGGRSVPAALVAAVLLCQPRFGAFEVDGELVAVPLVLAGFALLLAAARAPTARSALVRAAGAGGCAAAAALVKQNEIDVVVLLVTSAPVLGGSVVPRARALLAAAAGAVVVTAATLALAVRLGTRLPALWAAVVTFRLHASAVIAGQASTATSDRFHHLLVSALLAGVPLLLVRWLAGLPVRPPAGRPDLRLPTAAVLAWETFSVLGGGSYWQHYLICLVPGLVLAEATLTTARARSAPHRSGVALAVLTAACLVPLVPAYADHLADPGTRDDPTIAWLREHVRPGDTAIVAFGHADLLQATGMTSPYPQLWSLPVRVRDPELRRLTRVLWSHRRPEWIITGPSGDLSGWGIDDGSAEVPLRLLYRQVAYVHGACIFRLKR